MVVTGEALIAAVLLQVLGATPAAHPRGLAPADSVHVLRAARSAQISFEAFRRTRLPAGQRFGGPCDVHVGRYCYWRGDDKDEETPPPERADVRDRREQLILELDSASSALPGDAWLAGQRVRYLVEAERTDEAERFATSECRGGEAWCAALAGYAAHVAGQFARSDSMYRGALAAMGDTERCQWLDISDELDGDLAGRFTSVPCAEREAFVRRLFWLGAPLYGVSATDMLTEHFARLTRARLAERAASADGEVWGDDERELVQRYGWPRWFTRSDPQLGSQLPPSFTGHDAGRPYDFIPSLHAVDHPGAVTSDDWRLDDPHAATGYAPTYARSLHLLPCQVATFRRGDSTLVVAAWDASRDTTMLGRPLDAAVALSASPTMTAIAHRTNAGAIGRLWVTGVVDSGVASVELLATAEHRAARARIGVASRPIGRVALSDLLLYGASVNGAPVESLDEVRDSALTSASIAGTRPVGVYWETYGLRATGEPVRYTLSVEQIGVGWMHRAAERFHLADRTTGLRIQWQDVPRPAHDVAARGVRIDLSRLHAGRYRVQLAMSADGGAESPLSATREIEVR